MDGESKRGAEGEPEETVPEELIVDEMAPEKTADTEEPDAGLRESGVGVGEQPGSKPGDDEQVDSPVIDDVEIPTVEEDEGPHGAARGRGRRPQGPASSSGRRNPERPSALAARQGRCGPLCGAALHPRSARCVFDNLERALDSLPEGAGDGDGPLSQLVAGLELTDKELATVFERHSVVPIEALGERLDPNRHEAMFEVPDTSVPSGTVVQVIQKGYMMHDRLVRAARVGVSKGGPAAPPPEPETAADSAAEAGSESSPEPANDDTPRPGSHFDTEA